MTEGSGYSAKVDLLTTFPRAKASELANYRLVSRSWKAVADEHLFHEFFFKIHYQGIHSPTFTKFKNIYGGIINANPESSRRPWSNPNAVDDQTFYRDSKLRETLLRGGYTSLIRRLRVDLRFDPSTIISESDITEAYATYVAEYVDTVCEIILRSEACLQLDLTFTLFREDQNNALFPLKHVTSKFISVLHGARMQCPRAALYVAPIFPEIDAFNKEYANLTLDRHGGEGSATAVRREALRSRRMDLETWVLQDVLTTNLLSTLNALEIGVDDYTSPALFAALSSSTRLVLDIFRERKYGPLLALEPVTREINSLPLLRELQLYTHLLPSFPTNLECLSAIKLNINRPRGFEAFIPLIRLPNLLDLRLSLQLFIDYSPRQPWGQMFPTPLCTRLRRLELSALGHCKPFDDLFAALVENVPTLQVIYLKDVDFSDDIILRVCTKSLTDISFQLPKEVENRISWSALASMFAQNPNIKTASFWPHLRLKPFTYDDIHRIASSCSHLTEIPLTFLPHYFLDYRNHYNVEEAEQLIYLKTDQNSTQNEIIRAVLEFLYCPSHMYTIPVFCIIIKLAHFRELHANSTL